MDLSRVIGAVDGLNKVSGTGLRIGYSIALAVPVIGTWAAFLVFGGEFPSPDIISRLFVLHVLLVPAVIAGLLGAHMAILWRQKHTQFPGPGRTEDNIVGSRLWPTYAARSMGLLAGTAWPLRGCAPLVPTAPAREQHFSRRPGAPIQQP